MLKLILKKIKLHHNSINYWKKQGAVIGDNVEIAPSASLGSEPYLVEIGDNCKITNHVEFITHDGGVNVVRNIQGDFSLDLFKGKTILGSNVFIGNHACIMPGVKIGNNVIIGYGSIVTKDVPDNVVVGGIPAKIIKTISEYIDDNKENFLHTKKLDNQHKKEFLKNRYEK